MEKQKDLDAMDLPVRLMYLLGLYRISGLFDIRYPAGYPVSVAGYLVGRITGYPAGYPARKTI